MHSILSRRSLRGCTLIAMLTGVAAAVSTTVATGASLCFDANGQWLPSARPSPSITCRDVSVPSEATVQWAFLPKRPLSSPNRLIVTGAIGSATFRPTQVEADVPGPSMRTALPFGTPLLPRLIAAPFGTEERARLTNSDSNRVSVQCGVGSRPAGITLQGPKSRFPEGAKGSLRMTVAGQRGFAVGFVRAGQDPRQLQPIEVGKGAGVIEIALPDMAQDGGSSVSDALVIVCPEHAAELVVTDMQLIPRIAKPGHERAGWAWAERLWQQDGGAAVLRAAAEHQITTLYISVSVAGDRLAQTEALMAFLRRASAEGVAVWVVEGDPGMALDAGREHALSRLRAILAYQSTARPDARLAGVQYDIEPYLLAEYAEDPQRVATQWRETLRALSHTAGDMPMNAVVPFWILGSPGGEDVLSAIQMPGRSVTVMAYRSDLEVIQSVAEPVLAWGTRNNVPVWVALEAGPLPDELTQYYVMNHSATKSVLWTIPAQGGEVVVRFDDPVSLERGQGYRLIRDSMAPASRVSFLGDWPRMRATVETLQSILPAWASYAGISLHGLIE